MRRTSNIQTSSIIVFLSIFTIIVQFGAYYFFAYFYLIYGISAVISMLCCHLLLEQSTTYESCFIYSILTMFISSIITLLTYYGKETSVIPYSFVLLGLIFINWFIPLLHCLLRNMFDYGTRIQDFLSFYRNTSILFLICYIALLGYGSFALNSFAFIPAASAHSANFAPFLTLSSMIEDYLYDLTPLGEILAYLGSRILIFLPYGYYITLLLRKEHRFLRFFSVIFLPLSIELLQYFINRNRCDIDDLIYGFIGGILGAIWYYFCNFIYRSISGSNFLESDRRYYFTNHSLHF